MMSRKKSSGWTMAKALYVLPIAAFAAIAFANCSKTESEITQISDSQKIEKLPADQYKQILELTGGEVKEDMLIFNYEDATGELTVTSMSPDGTVRPVSDEELEKMRVPDDIVVEELIEESEKDFDNDQVFMIVEEMPEFPGGEEALIKFIAESTKYPEEAKNKRIEGKVFVQFVINKEGNVENVKLAKGVDPLLDEAAMNIVKSMPQWKPGRQRGQNVNVSFTIPINFQL